jgi:hypothetical protein
VSSQDFNCFVELVLALEVGALPNQETRQWFVKHSHQWLCAANDEPLHATLGMSRRNRLDYLKRRQQSYLEDALIAFVGQHQGTAWQLAGEFVTEIRRSVANYQDDELPVSRMRRALWLAHRLPLPIPMSRRHWFERLKPMTLCVSVKTADAHSRTNTTSDEDNDMAKKGPIKVSNTNELRTAMLAGYEADEIDMMAGGESKPAQTSNINEQALRAQFDADAELRAEFNNDFASFAAYSRANAAGLVHFHGRRA